MVLIVTFDSTVSACLPCCAVYAVVCGLTACTPCLLQVTPKISATEAAALEAGTIGFDRDIFDGTASVQGLKDKYPLVKLDEREQAFLDNEVR